ncbi:DegT/DnrJ/EryC1/StrS family aminotransferase [Arsukibacterium sp.]|uniref:DegT/DnrJ/EryC1/StrS family aminotransferase n=1 Tax=Arsukibacterium sp. TaxID=1977258 RepID=UPI00299EB59F|nr:DegT/DnrJ/EryC1/StrS family aminotransferase [Arsukibacterium sp.]MDX1538550.1 DegT/DnrJ/EryC1/StrS family aminotransferase [Arsukibacterium sp.]
MKIPFLDLKKTNFRYENSFVDASKRVIESGWYIRGSEVQQFENVFAQYCGVRNCIGVANGLDGLKLVLLAWKILGKLNDGDEVIVPSNTFIATVLAVSDVNLVPVFCEPDPETFNITSDSLRSVITSKTKVIIPVHLYGRICPMPDINSIADEFGLLVLEDSAQAHGAELHGLKAGAYGHAASFSFYPGKNLGALGDAGAITTNDDELSSVIRAVANYGSYKKYEHVYQGVNSRLDEIQAAFLALKIKDLDIDNKRRQDVARFYSDNIENINIYLPAHPADIGEHVWHLFVVRTNYRQELQDHLSRLGIETMIHYPKCPHKQSAYKDMQHLTFVAAEELQHQVLSLPNSPTLTDEETSYIVKSINSFKL